MKVTALGLVAVVAVLFSFAQQKKPVAVKGDVERGRYLAEHVAMCVQCHTPREADGTLIRSRLFDGAPIPAGRPAQFNVWAEYAPRIAGLPQYSEEQMITLLTTGIGREEKPLRAPMPPFRMTREDAMDIIAYLQQVTR